MPFVADVGAFAQARLDLAQLLDAEVAVIFCLVVDPPDILPAPVGAPPRQVAGMVQ
ncbi:hypothetical protein P4118_21465 [Pseudomonas aeruginosa]|nr:hypothetical protein [Pseudomonas aeruginosa]